MGKFIFAPLCFAATLLGYKCKSLTLSYLNSWLKKLNTFMSTKKKKKLRDPYGLVSLTEIHVQKKSVHMYGKQQCV